MDERLRFVARLLDGEKMVAVCGEFDISRKIGYKIFQRYMECGLDGLTDRSRRPYRHANRLPFQVEKLIVQLKGERPSWGAPKIREKLKRLHSDVQTPAISTVHAVLFRHGLVNRGRKRRYKAQGTTLSRPFLPNDLWCADDKGEFMLADKRYCYPLTISDSPAATCSPVRRWRPRRRSMPSPSSNAFSRNSACPRLFVPTTGCPSPALTRHMA